MKTFCSRNELRKLLVFLLKNQEDIQSVQGEPIRAMLDRARNRGTRTSAAV